jgi:Outer membrane protein Omp28
MRKLHFALPLAVLLSLGFLWSCSKSGGGNSGGGTTDDIKSLTVVSNKDSIYADGYDVAVLAAKDDKNNYVTNKVEFYAGNDKLTATSFKSAVAGTYAITARYKGISSPAFNIRVIRPRFTRKVLIEDYTGAWCGWCPLMSYALIQREQTSPNLIVSAVHYGPAAPGGTHDPFHSTLSSSLASRYNVNAYPTAIINRNIYTGSETVDNQLNFAFGLGRPRAGLSINSALAGSSLTGSVKVTFDDDFTSSTVKMVIMLVEDSLKANQTNYLSGHSSYTSHPYYTQPGVMPNYNHNAVLRAASGSILGDVVPAANTGKNAEYTANFSFNVGSYNAANCRIIAFVMTETGSQHEVINAQRVKAGQSQNYD